MRARVTVRPSLIARSLSCVLVALACGAPPARAQELERPAALKVERGTTLPLAGQSRRVHLLGAVELYALALYAQPSNLSLEGLASPETDKALRIQVLYREDFHRRLAIDWRRELVPSLEAAATAHLRGAFLPLRHGDVVIVEYAAGRGTTVRVNEGVAVASANHDLMLAFLDHWLGQRPVSEDLKRALLGRS
jgi:hypothetical protein